MTKNSYKNFFEPVPFTPPVVVEDLGNWWDLEKTVYIDTETTNGHGKGSVRAMDPESDIAIFQTNINDEIKIHRWNKETRDWLAKLNDEGWTFVFHNAAFDLFFLKMKGDITIHKVFDTMIASQVINAGKEAVDYATIISRKTEANSDEVLDLMDSMFDDEDTEGDPEQVAKKANFYSHSLGAVTWRYARVKIEKDLGNSDWTRDPLTPEQVRYAEEDVKYLPRIVKNMLHSAKKIGILKVLKLEMELLPAVVDMRYRGILIDRPAWEKKIEEYAIEADAMELELNEQLGMELAEREDLGDSVFGLFPVDFNVSSATQLKRFFKDEVVDGKPIESADEQTLSKLKHPLIPAILEFKGLRKLSTTYGTGYMRHIHGDGRIHAELKQTSSEKGKAIATGRFASSNPNLQNIPAKLLKSLIRAEKGYTLVTADYSSVEARILAYAANDPGYIDSVNSTDIHRVNASKMFKIPVSDVTSDQRAKAKVLSFAVPYGASAMGMWQKGLGETLEEAEKLLNDFYSSFPMVKKFLDKQVVDALTKGYTQDYYGRVRWYEKPEGEGVTREDISQAEKGIKRQAQNHPIQSLSASVTKMAILMLHQMLQETGWGHMILTIHDSIFFEIKNEFVAVSIPRIRKIMEEAARIIMPTLSAPADFDIGEYSPRIDKLSGETFYAYQFVLDSTGAVIPNPIIISEDTEKLLKQMGIKVDQKDLQGMFAQVLEKLPLQTPEWLEKNDKFVSSIQNLAQ